MICFVESLRKVLVREVKEVLRAREPNYVYTAYL
jgi:hypothetical protein